MISRRIARELSDKEFRNTYKRARVRTQIAYQIRALRKERDWLQGKLAEEMGKPQSTVSRLEDVDYGKYTLESLFEISDAFDVGLIVEFVSYPEFLVRTSNLLHDKLCASSYDTNAMQFLTRDTPTAEHVQKITVSPDDQSIIEINVGPGKIITTPNLDDIKVGQSVTDISTGVSNV